VKERGGEEREIEICERGGEIGKRER